MCEASYTRRSDLQTTPSKLMKMVAILLDDDNRGALKINVNVPSPQSVHKESGG